MLSEGDTFDTCTYSATFTIGWEATSSLDSESERLIQEALETLMAGRTSFIIAHRLATVRHVDRIIVIADGRIVESGTHDELQVIEDGVYRRLAALQFRE